MFNFTFDKVIALINQDMVDASIQQIMQAEDETEQLIILEMLASQHTHINNILFLLAIIDRKYARTVELAKSFGIYRHNMNSSNWENRIILDRVFACVLVRLVVRSFDLKLSLELKCPDALTIATASSIIANLNIISELDPKTAYEYAMDNELEEDLFRDIARASKSDSSLYIVGSFARDLSNFEVDNSYVYISRMDHFIDLVLSKLSRVLDSFRKPSVEDLVNTIIHTYETTSKLMSRSETAIACTIIGALEAMLTKSTESNDTSHLKNNQKDNPQKSSSISA